MIYRMELLLGDALIARLSTPLFLGNVNGARFNKETRGRANVGIRRLLDVKQEQQ